MKFEADALGFLIAYAKKTRHAFSAEDVTLAAQEAGMECREMRNWGAIFRTAAKDGYIRRSSTPFRRAMGNGTLTLGWVRC